MVTVMVDLDISKSFPDTFHILWEYFTFNQCLDYKGIPFRCLICHETVHVKSDYVAGFVGTKSGRRYYSSMSTALAPKMPRRSVSKEENVQTPSMLDCPSPVPYEDLDEDVLFGRHEYDSDDSEIDAMLQGRDPYD